MCCSNRFSFINQLCYLRDRSHLMSRHERILQWRNMRTVPNYLRFFWVSCFMFFFWYFSVIFYSWSICLACWFRVLKFNSLVYIIHVEKIAIFRCCRGGRESPKFPSTKQNFLNTLESFSSSKATASDEISKQKKQIVILNVK